MNMKQKAVIQDFLKLFSPETFQHKLHDNELWCVLDKNAKVMESKSTNFEVTLTLVFGALSEEVYQAWLQVGQVSYRWTDPGLVSKFEKACFERKIDPRLTFNGKFQVFDCDLKDDFISKVAESFSTGTCASKISVELELDDETIEALKKLAKNEDFSAIVEQALAEEIERVRKECVKMWGDLTADLVKEGISVVLKFDTKNVWISPEKIDLVRSWIVGLGLNRPEVSFFEKITSEGIEKRLSITQGEDTWEVNLTK